MRIGFVGVLGIGGFSSPQITQAVRQKESPFADFKICLMLDNSQEFIFANALLWLVVKNDIQEGAVNSQSAVVLNESELAEAIHEKADSGSGCADHLG